MTISMPKETRTDGPVRARLRLTVRDPRGWFTLANATRRSGPNHRGGAGDEVGADAGREQVGTAGAAAAGQLGNEGHGGALLEAGEGVEPVEVFGRPADGGLIGRQELGAG